MNYWNEKMETMPLNEIKALQLKLLRKLVSEMYISSKFYHGKMKEAGVKPDDIQTMKDVSKLPMMKKTDLRDNYPDKLFIRPQSEILRYHVSSGTTGKPTIVGYTRNDIENWSESLARAFVSSGLSNKDVMQISNGYGLFTGGLGKHYGAEKIGATVLPTGTGNTARQIELMRDLPVTAIACTPSYMFHIADECERMGVSIRNDTKLRVGILGAEPWSESMRKKLQERTGILAQNCYGTSELSGPMFTECTEQKGIHVWGDLCLMEILDKNGDPCADGERGEMVITMLQKEAFPLIRYRIGDISSLEWEKCECGRTHPRLQRLSGRTDDMLIIRGINVFPSQIEDVIGEMDFLTPFYHITVSSVNYMDNMLVEVEITDDALTDDMIKMEKMKREFDRRLKDVLNIKAEIKLALPGSMPRVEGKAKHVTDTRSYE
ncbi:MAG: phenylacetate--CoA ligase [Methanomassiliicoccaceae archaeon]|nr:phenylacetate--CoA ligase [Methanomassiliicoccaceae archaeon]